MRRILLIALLFACASVVACGGHDDATTGTPSPSATATHSASVKATRTTAPSLSGTESPTDTAQPATQTPHVPRLEPAGFPLDPQTPLGVVTSPVGSRTLVFDGSGPTAYDYSLNDQPSSVPDRANRSGWNCETHYEYEGIPAVDYYIPTGTPLIATMDGTATLYAVSYVNDFDRYGVSREPYLGNPDRSRAGYAPFPGPSSGLGVYVHIENDGYVTEYGHMDIGLTVNAVPASALVGGYSPSSDYGSLFADVPQPRVPTRIAEWQVAAGDVIGMSGDAGYSEAPHVHYTVQPAGEPLRCPTDEADFTNRGWLFR
jgi:murein DD-endopeptidase MepM/ murein hydrolase activator NlpD